MILLTVPHSKCEAGPENAEHHTCDPLASPFASALERALRALHFETVRLEGDVNRRSCDLNRAQDCESALKDAFNQQLRAGRTDFHFDVHSYPGGREQGQYELYLLDYSTRESTPLAHNLSLVAFLQARGARVALLAGSALNALIAGSSSAGIRSTLLEINEDVSHERMGALSGLIAQWLTKEVAPFRCAHCGTRTGMVSLLECTAYCSTVCRDSVS